jgi:hypothetical protein
MDLDEDTFLVTVYCLVDDLYVEKFAAEKPKRRGRKPGFSDSEVLTMALVAQWRYAHSERALLKHARLHWRSYFPLLPSQSWLNRRTRDLSGVLSSLGPAVYESARRMLGHRALYEVMDSVPVPLARRCRGERARLFSGWEASIGRGGSDKGWYYGVKMLAAASCDGFITGFVAGEASTEDRWLAEALFRWRGNVHAAQPSAEELEAVLGPAHRRGGRRRGPEGPLWPRLGAGRKAEVPIIADLGFRGREWREHWRVDYGASVLTKDDYKDVQDGEKKREMTAWLSGLRQKVETVFSVLCEVFGLKYPKARTLWGLKTRLSAKVAAFNIAVLVNYMFNRPPLSQLRPCG